MARIRLLLFFLILFNFSFAQKDAIRHERAISLRISDTRHYTFEVKTSETLSQRFELKNTYDIDTIYFIHVGYNEEAFLLEERNGKEEIIAKCGRRVPVYERSVKEDYRVLAVRLKAGETKNIRLSVQNFYEYEKIHLALLNYASYQQVKAERNGSFNKKYWNPGYLSVLILFLILALIQYFVLPEKVIIYYIFYLIFTFIRSAAYIESLILEEWIPALNSIHYSSLNSQVFTYISFIFYVLFIREFTGFAEKKPRLDIFFKIQIGYLVVFAIFDLIFPNEKYSNLEIYSVFRFLETVGLVLGLLNLVLVFKVYDNFNKFVLLGALSLCIIGVFGQEVIKRKFSVNTEPELLSVYLSVVWSLGYLVEIILFAAALLNRQRLLLDTIRIERERNDQLDKTDFAGQKKTLEESIPDFNSFSLATNKGILVFQQSEIIRLEASGSYTIFSIQNQKQVLASHTLSDFESKLNPVKFLRVHKSHIVNLDYVVKYTKGDGGVLTLRDGSEIPVSRSRKEELLHKLPSVK